MNNNIQKRRRVVGKEQVVRAKEPVTKNGPRAVAVRAPIPCPYARLCNSGGNHHNGEWQQALINRCNRLSCSYCVEYDSLAAKQKIQELLSDVPALSRVGVTVDLLIVERDEFSGSHLTLAIEEVRAVRKELDKWNLCAGYFVKLEFGPAQCKGTSKQPILIHIHCDIALREPVNEKELRQVLPAGDHRTGVSIWFDWNVDAGWIEYISKGCVAKKGLKTATRQRICEVLRIWQRQSRTKRLWWRGKLYSGHTLRWARELVAEVRKRIARRQQATGLKRRYLEREDHRYFRRRAGYRKHSWLLKIVL